MLVLRLSFFHAAVFFVIGVQLPFWPVFLTARGLDAQEVGLILAGALWVKVFANPIAGLLADRSGDRSGLMLRLAALGLGAACLFVPARGFWPLLVATLMMSAGFSALIPLGDNLTLAAVPDYGRVRVWGSVSFIAAAGLAGILLGRFAPDIVLYLVIAALTLTVLACALLPRSAGRRNPPSIGALRRLVCDPRLLLFLAAATAIQASHSVYYGFATLHWRSLGHAESVIGALWAEGVVAEIVLFAVGAPLVRRLGPARLLLLAGIAGVLRWSGTAVAVTLPPLVLLQLLHALTFGAAHLAAMGFLAQAVPPALSATGQSLYSATVAGIGFGLVMAGAGILYAGFGAGSYFAMAALSGCGALAAAALAALWHGERVATATS